MEILGSRASTILLSSDGLNEDFTALKSKTDLHSGFPFFVRPSFRAQEDNDVVNRLQAVFHTKAFVAFQRMWCWPSNHHSLRFG